MNRGMTFAALAGFALVASPLAPAVAEDMTVVGYGGLIQDWSRSAYWQPFEKASGIHLVEDTRDYGIGIIRTKVQGGANTWDVVSAEDIEVIQGCEEGLYQKLDWSKIKGSANFIPGGKLPCGEAQIIYAMNLVFDGARITGNQPKTWADFWNLQKWPGKRTMYKDPRDALEIALMADGVARGDVYKILATPAGVDRAFKKLDAIKSDVIWWVNPGASRQTLMSGDVVLAATYGGAVLNINRQQHTKLVVSFQDQVLHTDYFAIIKGTPHLAAAEKLMDYYSEAEPESKFSQMSGAGVPNKEAFPLVQKLDPEVAANLNNSPDHLAISLPSDAQFWLEHYDNLNQRFTAWLAH